MYQGGGGTATGYCHTELKSEAATVIKTRLMRSLWSYLMAPSRLAQERQRHQSIVHVLWDNEPRGRGLYMSMSVSASASILEVTRKNNETYCHMYVTKTCITCMAPTRVYASVRTRDALSFEPPAMLQV